MATPAASGSAQTSRSQSTPWRGLLLGLPLLVVGLLVAVPSGLGGTAPHVAGAPRAEPVAAAALGASAPSLVASATPSPTGGSNWTAVQVAFLLETTAYDGVYDASASDPGYDGCAGSSSSKSVCEESNAVPFFEVHAGQIAQAIAAAHPGTNVTFAMGDFFASLDALDDGDGSPFHVDVQNFTAATGFGSAVNSTFRKNVTNSFGVYPDSDLSDNILHSPSITSLYGALGTSGFKWSNSAHHVVVLIGSTAPRAPGYSVNYFDSASDYSTFCGKACITSTCEPMYNFSSGSMPACEGWVNSQTTNASQSIAWLAQRGTLCARSLGANCTVDTISLYNGVTDPASKQWPAGRTGGGPNGVAVKQDVGHILNASCDLAAATGGSWNGPSFYTCPNGLKGNLSFVAVGNSTNPTLVAALRSIGFGAPAARHPGFNQVGDLLITDQFNNRVIEVNPLTRQIVWSYGTNNASRCNPGPGAVIAPNSAERIGGGLTLIAGTGTTACPDNRVIVVNEAGDIVWQYGVTGQAGNASGYLNTPVDAVQLPNHHILIVDQVNNRVIEVNLKHTIVWSYGPTNGTGALSSPNSAELLANGDVLIADEGNDRVIEINHTGTIVWSSGTIHYAPASASRLANGNTLIAASGSSRILVITPNGHAVFSFNTNRSKGSVNLTGTSDAVQLPGGSFLVTDQFNDRVIVVSLHHQIVYQYGKTAVPGNGFDRLFDPYSAMAVGDYLGVTAPPPSFY